MSNDLTWWVRDAANSICGQTGATTHQEKLLEAADEIERLRLEVADYRAAYGGAAVTKSKSFSLPMAGFEKGPILANIKIEWLHDDHDCETCGASYAEGARVTIDGAVALDLQPVAHCFDGKNWQDDDVYKLILEKLGYTVEADR